MAGLEVKEESEELSSTGTKSDVLEAPVMWFILTGLTEPSKKSSSAWDKRTDGWIEVLNLKLWVSSSNLEGLTIL